MNLYNLYTPPFKAYPIFFDFFICTASLVYAVLFGLFSPVPNQVTPTLGTLVLQFTSTTMQGMQCSIVQCSTGQYGVVCCSLAHCIAVQCVQANTCGAMHYSVLQCILVVQCSAVSRPSKCPNLHTTKISGENYLRQKNCKFCLK